MADIDALCKKAWGKLEERLAVSPVQQVLNKHDRGEALSAAEVELLKQFVEL